MRLKPFIFVMMIIITSSYAENKAVIRFEKRKVIEQDETWEGIYEITDGILIASGRTLTLKPGTRITFLKTGNSSDIDIRGRILAQGTAANPIIINSNVKNPGSWQGIYIFSESKRVEGANLSQFSHVKFSYADTTIKLERSAVNLDNCEINKSNIGLELIIDSDIKANDTTFSSINNTAVKIERGSTINLDNCDFRFNKTGILGSGEYHLTVTGSKFTRNEKAIYYSNVNTDTVITKNQFIKNEYGIQLDRRTRGQISHNRFSDNTYGILAANQSSPDIINNLFTGNKKAIICLRMGTPLIKQNEMYNNITAIECLLGSYPKVQYNNIYNNRNALFLRFMSTDWEIFNNVSDQLTVFDVSKNWWGESITKIIEEKGNEYNRPDIFDGYDVPYNQDRGFILNKQKVSYDKWLTSKVDETYSEAND